MSQEDRRRWDQKWLRTAGEPYSPHPLLVKHKSLLSGGIALDLACGKGQNTLWMADLGYRVLGLDISGVALRTAFDTGIKAGLSGRLLFVQIDLDMWSLPEATFDLICVFRFLNRRLFPEIKCGLKSGGLIFYSTRHLGLLDRQPEANQDFLLQPGELIREFSDWEVVHYVEGRENEQIIARLP